MSVHRHLGFVDWGIGGLSVLREVLQREPQLQITYVSDSGFTPYGKLSAVELRERLVKIFLLLKSQGCDGIVIACNAASTTVLDLAVFESTPIYNVISPTIQALTKSPFKHLGIIGGDRTIDSHIYRDQLMAQTNMSVTENSAQPLSALIEDGQIDSNEVFSLLKNVFSVFQNPPIDGLVLACTHYPAVRNAITQMEPSWTLLDPAVFVAQSLAPSMGFSETPVQNYWTTGSPLEMISSVQKAFGINLTKVQSLSLP